jgi:hypothetical protein
VLPPGECQADGGGQPDADHLGERWKFRIRCQHRIQRAGCLAGEHVQLIQRLLHLLFEAGQLAGIVEHLRAGLIDIEGGIEALACQALGECQGLLIDTDIHGLGCGQCLGATELQVGLRHFAFEHEQGGIG